MHKHKHVHMHMEGYHAFLLFPLRYHTEIRLTGIKYYIHQNKRWQFFQIYHLKNAGSPLNTYKMTHVLYRYSPTNWRLWTGVILYARLSYALNSIWHSNNHQSDILKDFILHTKVCLTLMHLSTASLNFSSSFCSDNDFTRMLSNKLCTFSSTACFWIVIIASLAQCSASL